VPQPKKKVVKAPVAKPPAEPPKVVLQAPPDMSRLRAMVDAQNARVEAAHQAAMIAWQIEQDDAEIFALLRMVDDA
jgi:hypothetical protein